MSGIELAGLVLGALPLIIAGLEAYNDSLDPLKAFYRWERELPHFIHKLRQQHVHFEQTVRILFAPITTEKKLAQMMADPLGAWKDEEVAENLRYKLEEAYAAYEATMVEIGNIMTKIASKLDIERARSVTRNDLEAILLANPQQPDSKFQFRKRVKFSMSKKKIQALLEELNQCNRQLERFSEKSEKLEPYRRPCKPSFAKRLQRLQLCSKQLHSALLDSWSCSCHASHMTNLKLEQRLVGATQGMRKAGDSQGRDIQFAVSFSSTCPPWSWQEAQVSIYELEEDPEASKDCLSPRTSIVGRRSVGFVTPPPTPPASRFVSRASTITTLVSDDITDICSVIHQLHQETPCIGFSLSKGGKLQGGHVMDGAVQASDKGYNMVTLDDLLNTQISGKMLGGRLTKKERYILAVNLASSTLQLYASPWIGDQWGKKNILFRVGKTGSRTVDIEHPYVAMDKITTKTKTNAGSTMGPKNATLLSLAVTLMELYFGVGCEQEQLPQLKDYLEHPSPWALLAMTYEWANREQGNLSAAFSTAVKCCLQSFSDPSSTLVDDGFLQSAVEGIVLPLQDELWQFLGKPVP